MDWKIFLIKALPYVIAALIAATGLPSFFLRKRYHGITHRPYIDFACRWTSVSNIISLPLVTLFYSGTDIVLLYKQYETQDIDLTAILIIFLVIYLVFIILALWLGMADFSGTVDGELPSIRIKGRTIVSYDGLVTIIKVAGVLIPGILNLTLFAIWRS